MRWRIIIPRRVGRQLANLPDDAHDQIAAAIELLRTAPERVAAVALRGVESGWRFKTEGWRMLYLLLDADHEVYIGDIVRRSNTTYSKQRLRRLAERTRENPDPDV